MAVKQTVICKYKKSKDGWSGGIEAWSMGFPPHLNHTLPTLKKRVNEIAKYKGVSVKFVRIN
jgi:hypothetical protein